MENSNDTGCKFVASSVTLRPKNYLRQPIETPGHVRFYRADADGSLWEIEEVYDKTLLPEYKNILARIEKSGRDGIGDRELTAEFGGNVFKVHIGNLLYAMCKTGETMMMPVTIRRRMTEKEKELLKTRHPYITSDEISDSTLKYFAKKHAHAMHITEELRASLI